MTYNRFLKALLPIAFVTIGVLSYFQHRRIDVTKRFLANYASPPSVTVQPPEEREYQIVSLSDVVNQNSDIGEFTFSRQGACVSSADPDSVLFEYAATRISNWGEGVRQVGSLCLSLPHLHDQMRAAFPYAPLRGAILHTGGLTGREASAIGAELSDRVAFAPDAQEYIRPLFASKFEWLDTVGRQDTY